jgi:hypothetical protein
MTAGIESPKSAVVIRFICLLADSDTASYPALNYFYRNRPRPAIGKTQPIVRRRPTRQIGIISKFGNYPDLPLNVYLQKYQNLSLRK